MSEKELVSNVPLLEPEVIELMMHSYMRRTTSEDERHEPEVGVYHSSSGAQCLRKRWYSDRGVWGESFGGGGHGIFERGDRVEDFFTDVLIWGVENPDKLEEFDEDGLVDSELKNLLQKAEVHNSKGMSDPVEYDGTGEFKVVGSTDPYITVNLDIGGLDGPDEDMLALCEVKSKTEVNGKDEPDFHHKIQLNTYLNVLDIDYGLFVYIGARDFDDYQILKFERDEAMWEATKSLHGVYHIYREQDELPPKLPVSPGDCKWCEYRGLCARDKRGDDYR